MKKSLLYLFVAFSAIMLSSCAILKTEKLETSLAGTWIRPDTGTEIVIENKKSGGYKFVSAIDQNDNEVFKITKSEWKKGVFSFGYSVPSTSYYSNFVVKECTKTTMTVLWTGTTGEELEYFERKE